MVYALIYLSVGILFLIFKTPIRKLIDDEISKIKIHYVIRGEDPPSLKLILFRITVSALLTVIYPIMLFVTLKKKLAEKPEKELFVAEEKFVSEPSFLKENITIEEAEEKNMIDVDGQSVSFGYLHNQWENLCKEMKKGDQLYNFRTPDESWNNLAGREGIALVREGKIVAEIITIMS